MSIFAGKDKVLKMSDLFAPRFARCTRTFRAG